MVRRLLILLILVPFFTVPAYAQFGYFGKNQVVWEKVENTFYRSQHFNFYLKFNPENDEKLMKHLKNVVTEMEGAYQYYSSDVFNWEGQPYHLQKRPNVFVYMTHWQLEASPLLSGVISLPEGLGAFAEPSRCRVALKRDFMPPLAATIARHELVHIFQFDLLGLSQIERIVVRDPLPLALIEGMAEFWATKMTPYTRDDIRRREQRGVSVNPEKDLPTWETLVRGAGNAYTMGAMVFEFIEKKYGHPAVKRFANLVLRERKPLYAMEKVSSGELSGPEMFDRIHRDFWREFAAKSWSQKARPFDETDFVRGRDVMPARFPYPAVSPVLSPDGKTIAFMTIHRKYGLIVATAPALEREDTPYNPEESEYMNRGNFLKRAFVNDSPERYITVLTPHKVLKHYELIIAQQLVTWPFSGRDLAWWQDSEWAAEKDAVEKKIASLSEELEKLRKIDAEKREASDKERISLLEFESMELFKTLRVLKEVPNTDRIAFFAKKDRDHVLFVIDVETKKIIFESAVPEDQAFSPAFSPDGTKIYYSATKNMTRDIYSVELESGITHNITNDEAFDGAPAVSPDGTKIVYISFVGDFQKMFLFNLETGQREQVTFNRTNEDSPIFSADGNTILYVSDEYVPEDSGRPDAIWNLYSLDVSARVAKQWTDVYGGVYTPYPFMNEPDRVVVGGFWQFDQYREYIYSNLELFDMILKKPTREFVLRDKKQYMRYAFHPEDSFPYDLDPDQVAEPIDPPAQWKLHISDMYAGATTYYGAYVSTRFLMTDIEEGRRLGGMVYTGGWARFFTLAGVDTRQRWAKGFSLEHSRLPLYYQFYGAGEGRPKELCPDKKCREQLVLNSTYLEEYSARAFTQYPFNKFNRMEFGLVGRYRKYLFVGGLNDEFMEKFNDFLSPNDRGFYGIFKGSSGRGQVAFNTAFIHDSVLFHRGALGPVSGNLLRVEAEFAPSTGNLLGYTSAFADARKYIQIGNSSALLAFRGVGKFNSGIGGDFMLLGGTSDLRGYPYYSIAGNNIAYGSAELRFKLLEGIIFPGGIGVGPIRGKLFGDYAIAKFSEIPDYTGKEWSYGFGVQFGPFNCVWARRRFDPKKFKFDFYFGYSF